MPLPPDREQVQREETLAGRRTQAEEEAKLEELRHQQREAAAALTETLKRKAEIDELTIADEEFGKRISELRKKYVTFKGLVESAQEAYAQVSRDLEVLRRTEAAANVRLLQLKNEIESAKTALAEILSAIGEHEHKPVELKEKIAVLSKQRDELEQYIEARKTYNLSEMSKLEDRRRELERIHTDLTIYDHRLREEYRRMFPDIPYKSPFGDGKEG